MTDELLKDLLDKQVSAQQMLVKRAFIIIITLIILLFASNAIWLYAWTLPDYETYETYELDGEDSSNVVYNSQEEVKINDKEGQ